MRNTKQASFVATGKAQGPHESCQLFCMQSNSNVLMELPLPWHVCRSFILQHPCTDMYAGCSYSSILALTCMQVVHTPASLHWHVCRSFILQHLCTDMYMQVVHTPASLHWHVWRSFILQYPCTDMYAGRSYSSILALTCMQVIHTPAS